MGRAKTKKQGQIGAKGESPSFLSRYFQEMSGLNLLNPEQELASAQEIEQLEIGLWEVLLSHKDVSHSILRRIEPELQSPPSFKSMRRNLTLCRRKNSDGNKNKLARAFSKIGLLLRRSDKDRLVVEKLLEHLRKLKNMEQRNQEFILEQADYDTYLFVIEQASQRAHLARNRFAKANLRLVVSIARRYNHGRLPLADLIQEGNLGLIKAVQRFDHHKGFRFSTYASWWIRHAISRAQADKGREVRIPVHMIDAHHKLNKARRTLNAKLLREPTINELSEETHIDIQKIERMRSYLLDTAISLDKPINDEDGRTLGDTLEDPDTLGSKFVHRLSLSAESKRMRSFLKELKPMETDILRQRFGLDDQEEHTLKEIGLHYNLSRERIRQLQEKALEKIRRAMSGAIAVNV